MLNSYQPNLENMQQYLAQENDKNYGDGPNWWSIPSGTSSIRILPPWDPTGRIALPVYMHPIEYKGKDMSYTKYNWTCVNKTFGKPCPICDGLAELSASGVDTSNWEPNRRQFYFNAIVMSDPSYNGKDSGVAPGTHVLMRAPKTLYDWVVQQITNPQIGDITNIQNGIDIFVTKTGQGLGTTYTMTFSPNGRTPIPNEYLEKITDLYNLDDIFSAGFNQEQVNELVDHLKRSAGAISTAIPNTMNQMGGYQSAPTQVPPMNNPIGVVPPMNNPMSAPSPFNQQVQNMQVPPSPVIPPQGVPANFTMSENSQTMNSPSSSSPTPTVNQPKCFGNYDPGSVNCVVCPAEVSCSKSKK